MDYNLLARTAKLVALFGFFLPWVTVSCSGTEIAAATGVQLMTGDIQPQGPLASQEPPDADPSIVVILAFALVGLGLLGSLLTRGRAAGMTLLLSALAAFALTYWGMQNLHAAVAREVEQAQSGDPPVSEDGATLSARAQQEITRAVAGMVKVEERRGYWVTLLALLGAGGLALTGLALRPAAPISPASGSPPNNQSPGSPPDHIPRPRS